jgi:ubiquinone/menaquinone biosynthesis C-methylase UbiE
MALNGEQIGYAATSRQMVESGYYTRILDKIPDVRKCRDVLEVGVGPGGWLLALARMLGENAHLVGGDIAEEWLCVTGERLAEEGFKSFQLMILDAQALPFAAESFDLVISSLVLPYVGDEKQACGELARVLRPGGKALVLYHSPKHLFRRLFRAKLKTRLYSLAGIVSTLLYFALGRKLLKNTFQTASRLESAFLGKCSAFYKDSGENGIGTICFVKGEASGA